MNEEEKKAIEYYQNKEVSLSVDFDTENLLKALGITEEDNFENHQIRFKTLLNLVEKLQKENEELNKLHIQDNKHLDFIMKHSIPIQKIKDKIKILEKLQNEFLNNEELRVKIIAYKELIEERSDTHENM